jgi:DNA-binding response OmpR family regulator
MTHQHHILTRDQIIDDAFGIDYDGNDRTIDSYIKRLRQKIEASPKDPLYLKTKYGQGYVFGGDES